MRLLMALVTSVVLATPVFSQTVPYDQGFSGVTLNWRGAGETTVLFDVKQSGSDTLVCGFYFIEGSVPDVVNKKALIQSSIRVGRVSVMRNLVHFNQIEFGTPPSKARATCKPARAEWRPEFAGEAKIRVPRSAIEY